MVRDGSEPTAPPAAVRRWQSMESPPSRQGGRCILDHEGIPRTIKVTVSLPLLLAAPSPNTLRPATAAAATAAHECAPQGTLARQSAPLLPDQRARQGDGSSCDSSRGRDTETLCTSFPGTTQLRLNKRLQLPQLAALLKQSMAQVASSALGALSLADLSQLDVATPRSFTAPKQPPLVPLAHRAVHPFFLEAFIENDPQMLAVYSTTKDIVQHVIKTRTAEHKCDYVQAIYRKDHHLAWCKGGTFLVGKHQGQPVHGPATYYVSHCWADDFRTLVKLICRHYDKLPETNHGRDFVPIFYWLDFLSLSQHHHGDIKHHPDGLRQGLPMVIGLSRGLLLMAKPWFNPLCFGRAWCLFEVLLATWSSTPIELLACMQSDAAHCTAINPIGDTCNPVTTSPTPAPLSPAREAAQRAGSSPTGLSSVYTVRLSVSKVNQHFGNHAAQPQQQHQQEYSKDAMRLLLQATEQLDISKAATREPADLQYIASCVMHKISAKECNKCLRKTLRAVVCSALVTLLKTSFASSDFRTAVELVRGGVPFEVDLPKHVEAAGCGDDAAVVFANALQLPNRVERLNLAGQVGLRASRLVGEPGLMALAQVVEGSSNCQLKVLILRDNVVTDKAVAALAQALQSNTSLHTLDLGNNGLTWECGAALGGLLRGSRSLMELRLDGNKADFSKGVVAFSQGLGANTSLRSLSLQNCMSESTGTEGRFALDSLLKSLATVFQHGCLEKLDLSGLPVRDRGAAMLARSLRAARSATLNQLGLRNCLLDVAGAKAIAGVLQGPGLDLTLLALSNNNVGDRAVEEMAAALQTNLCLEQLDLSHAGLDWSCGAALGTMLRANGCLRNLILDGNSVAKSPEGFIAFVHASFTPQSRLPGNALALRHLSLRDCLDCRHFQVMARGQQQQQQQQLPQPLLVSQCVLALADIIKYGHKLQSLDLTGTNLAPEDMAVIADAMRMNRTTRIIGLPTVKQAAHDQHARDANAPRVTA